MNEQQREIVDILQEECAEVIQMVSKCRRFGIDMTHFKDGGTNRERLAEEVGDVQCMINLLIERGVVSQEAVDDAAKAKAKKLRQWSSIYG